MISIRKYYLYVLMDPILKSPKYVGITNNPKERLRSHLKDNSITKKTKWINSLKSQNLSPIMKPLKETSNVREVIEWEIKYIEKLKNKYDLTNSTSGGEYQGIGTPIQVFDLEGKYIESYSSMIEYVELNELHPNSVSAISAVCLRKRNYAYNRIFRYLEDSVTEEDLTKLKNSFHSRDPKHFFILSINGEILGEFNSLQEAELEGFGEQNRISQVLRQVDGYNSINGNLVCNTIDEFPERLKKYTLGLSKGALSQPISKYDLDGNYIESFYTYSDAVKDVKTSRSTIKACCELKYKQAGGFQWRFGIEKQIPPCEKKSSHKQNKKVAQYTLNDELIKIWNSCREAANALNTKRENINRAAKAEKTSIGFKWKYIEE